MISMRIRITDNDTTDVFDHGIVLNDRNSVEFSDLFFQNIFNSIGDNKKSFSIGDIHISCKNATVVINILIPHPMQISMAGFWYNMTAVTLGNIVGGAFFVGMAYWYISKNKNTD